MNETFTSSSTRTATRIVGQRGRVIQIGWLTLTALTLSLFAVGLPHSLRQALTINAATAASLDALGLPMWFPALLFIGTDVLTILVFGGFAILLFLVRRDDWMALFIGQLLLLTAIVYSGPVWDAPVPLWLPSILIALGESSQVLFLYLFPDGRFVPKIARWLVPILAIWRPAIWIVLYMPGYRAGVRVAETYGVVVQSLYDIVPFLLLLAGGIGFQIYRYRRISSPEGRQQTKWLMLGTTLAVTVVGGYVLTVNVLGLIPESASVLVTAFGRLFRQIGLSAVPVTLAIAILRFRLWDINFVINRSIVYGSVSVMLAVVFGFVVVLVRASGLVSDVYPLITYGLGALVVALLFQPVRERVIHFVDHQIYHIAIDYRDAQAYRSGKAVTPLTSQKLTTFRSYADLALVGRGGMGEVYRARGPEGDTVAIKLMREDLRTDPDSRRRFLREAQTLTRITSPHIVQLHDYGDESGVPFMIMEYIGGPTLDGVIAEFGPLPLPHVESIISDVATALDTLHHENVIHRDVKPGNILLDSYEDVEGPGRAVLMDFGIVYVGDHTALTQAGLVGTFDTIAPEQIKEDPNIDGRADVYSLGIVAYTLLCGQLPYQHNNPGALLMAHLMQPPPDPRTVRADLPIYVGPAIRRALAKDPADRYPTASAFAEALRGEE